MAISISKAQSRALASGLLDNMGEDFKPTESLSALFQLAGGLVDQAQGNLVQADKVASGALSDSIRVNDPVQLGSTVRIDISALKYYAYLNDGVRGVKGGSGKYAFKNLGVGREMLSSIRKWVIKEGLKARTNTGRSITKRESKRKSITDTSTRTAYAIAVGVKKKGIRASHFFTNAVKTTQSRAANELGAALKIDIINTLPKSINGNNDK